MIWTIQLMYNATKLNILNFKTPFRACNLMLPCLSSFVFQKFYKGFTAFNDTFPTIKTVECMLNLVFTWQLSWEFYHIQGLLLLGVSSPHFPCSYTYLILRRVLKCQPPASNQSLHFLKTFLQTQKSACRETLGISLLLIP